MNLLFKNETEAATYEKEIAADPRNFDLILAHIDNAHDEKEGNLRFLAMRKMAKRPKGTWEFSSLEARQNWKFEKYTIELSHLRSRRREAEKHFAALEAEGIPREIWHLHPFMDEYQKQRQREFLAYVSLCEQTGEPIEWERRRY